MGIFHVVILNWNAASDTIRCVRQLEGWNELAPMVWVVDNGSEPEDLRVLASAVPEGRLVSSTINLGYSGGTNLGVRRAIETIEAPVLLLNNDLEISEHSVEKLLRTLEFRPDCGVVGPVLYRPDGDGETVLSAGSRNPVLHRFPAITEIESVVDDYSVAFVSGAAALIRPAVFRQAGFFDEQYFFATEMADLCRRAEKSGFSCLVNPRAAAVHDVQKSTALRETLYVYYVVRNRFRYIMKFHRMLAPVLIGFWALYGYEQAWRIARQGRTGTAEAIRIGVAHGLRRRFGGRNREVLERLGMAVEREALS